MKASEQILGKARTWIPVNAETSKGQVTIPKQIRDALRIGAGDRVAFIVRQDGVVELRPETVDLKVLYGMLTHKGKPVTVQEMNEGIAEVMVRSFEHADRK